ncbi:glutamate receptor ionotropic, kainate glr-3-like [Eriocheir sinensis]|uniref:glutamate receptor ionotropic, kainate glr-3-like n=1 Tax=Eriocheir sinensis TaxID=95602 RepID=UPI0021C91447|nr:glutamate receptor ionotropic, kainate glr-3-like [Eriocheir sinensis]
MANLIETLAQALNFSYTLVRPMDGAWGAPDDQGNWNGMIGMVKRNEADLALGPFGMTEARAKVVEFSHPILIDQYKILVKKGSAQFNPWGFLNPLQPLVWSGVFLTYLLMCTILTAKAVARHLEHSSSTSIINEALRCFWNQLAILLQQTLQTIPEPLVTRALTGLWLLTVMIIMRSYSGALTSLLAVRQIPVKINALQDLVDAEEYGLLFEQSTALTAYMQEAKSGIYRELEATKEQGRAQFMNSTEISKAAHTLVKQEDYALLVDIISIRKILSDDFSNSGTCDYYIAKEAFFPLIFCIIGRHGLHHMQYINSKIRSIVEHDLYTKWLLKESNNVTACIKAPTSITVQEPYSFLELWGMFTLLFVGLLLAALMFLAELVVHKWISDSRNLTHW